MTPTAKSVRENVWKFDETVQLVIGWNKLHFIATFVWNMSSMLMGAHFVVAKQSHSYGHWSIHSFIHLSHFKVDSNDKTIFNCTEKGPWNYLWYSTVWLFLFIFVLRQYNLSSIDFSFASHLKYYKILSIHGSLIFLFSHKFVYVSVNHSNRGTKTLFPFIVFSTSITRLLLPFSIFPPPPLFIIYNTSFSVFYIRNPTISAPFPLFGGRKILF